MELCKEYKLLNSLIKRDELNEGFELEFQENLPQYLDDIEKIVKCSVKSVITDYECSTGAIKLYGKSIISLTYINGDACVLSNIFEEDFTRQINTKISSDVKFADISLTSKYSSYRLINQRRIDIRVSLRADISTFCEDNDKYLSNCKNAFVRQYSCDRLCVRSFGICSEEFDESFTISDTSAQIKNIINTFSFCTLEDKKIIKDKMLVKYKIELSVLYENENNSIEKTVHTFSVSKIIDVASAGEDDKALVNAHISGIYVKTKSDSGNRLCDIEIVGKITFSYKLLYTMKEEFIVDSYMTRHNAQLECKSITLNEYPQLFYDTKTAELMFDIEGNVIEILDLTASLTSCKINSSQLTASVKLELLYVNDASELCFFEGVSEYKLSLADSSLSGVAGAGIISFDYVIKNTNSVELRVNLEYTAYLYNKKELSVITDINATDEKPDSSSQPQLTLYFAHKDEDVWDIAKRFSTASSLIIDENNLSSQVIDCQRILLVPGM